MGGGEVGPVRVLQWPWGLLCFFLLLPTRGRGGPAIRPGTDADVGNLHQVDLMKASAPVPRRLIVTSPAW